MSSTEVTLSRRLNAGGFGIAPPCLTFANLCYGSMLSKNRYFDWSCLVRRVRSGGPPSRSAGHNSPCNSVTSSVRMHHRMKAIIANRIAQKAIIMGASRGSLVEVMALKVQSDLHHTGLRNRGMHTLCQNIIKHPSQMQIGSSSSGRSAIACRIVGRKAGGHLEQIGHYLR